MQQSPLLSTREATTKPNCIPIQKKVFNYFNANKDLPQQSKPHNPITPIAKTSCESVPITKKGSTKKQSTVLKKNKAHVVTVDSKNKLLKVVQSTSDNNIPVVVEAQNNAEHEKELKISNDTSPYENHFTAFVSSADTPCIENYTSQQNIPNESIDFTLIPENISDKKDEQTFINLESSPEKIITKSVSTDFHQSVSNISSPIRDQHHIINLTDSPQKVDECDPNLIQLISLLHSPTNVEVVSENQAIEESSKDNNKEKCLVIAKKKQSKPRQKKVNSVTPAKLDSNQAGALEVETQSKEKPKRMRKPKINADAAVQDETNDEDPEVKSVKKKAPKQKSDADDKIGKDENEHSQAEAVNQNTPIININKEKMISLVQELCNFESLIDLKDVELMVDLAVLDLIDLIKKFNPANVIPMPVEKQSDQMTASDENAVPQDCVVQVENHNDDPIIGENKEIIESNNSNKTIQTVQTNNPEQTLMEKITFLVRSIVARFVQGRSLTLSQLASILSHRLNEIVILIEDFKYEDIIIPEEVLNENKATVIEVLKKLNEVDTTLQIEIKELSNRESYGVRHKFSVLFDDEDPLAIFRWEIHSMMYFDKSSLAVIREVRAYRNRYARAIKAICKVNEQLLKFPFDATKMPPLEERSAKCLSEVEKAKEKRRELELKREADAEEKLKKEEQKELKRKEKEEANEKKRQLQLATAALVKSSEKKAQDPKLTQQLEKQKNIMSSFFQSGSKASNKSSENQINSQIIASNQSSVPTSAIKSRLNTVIQLSEEENGIVMIDINEQELIQQKLIAFEEALAANLTLNQILINQKSRYIRSLDKKRSRSKTHGINKQHYKTIYVTVTFPVSHQNTSIIMPDETYSEVKPKRISRKVRTFSFAEDHRPAYVGTFSKKSQVVNGRRPFEKDSNIFDYDVDSEAEWEEELEGEDIMNSDDEEDEPDIDDYQNDGCIIPDNECDDLDADGERIVVPGMMDAIGIREKEEIIGLRFIVPKNETISSTSSMLNYLSFGYPNSINNIDGEENCEIDSSCPTLLPSIDNEALKLLHYQAVVFPINQSLPYLSSKCTLASIGATSLPIKVITQTKSKPSAITDHATDTTKEVRDNQPATVVKTKLFKGFDESKLQELVQFVHGKKDAKEKLIIGFNELYPHIAKINIEKKMSEVFDKLKHADGYGTARWTVKKEFSAQLLKEYEGPSSIEFTPPRKKKRVAPVPITTGLSSLAPSIIANTNNHIGNDANSSTDPDNNTSIKSPVTIVKASGSGIVSSPPSKPSKFTDQKNATHLESQSDEKYRQYNAESPTASMQISCNYSNGDRAAEIAALLLDTPSTPFGRLIGNSKINTPLKSLVENGDDGIAFSIVSQAK
eukprot:gene6180-8511_t